MINAIQTALSGLLAATRRVEASASNIANLQTAGSLEDPQNPPYSARIVRQTQEQGGVRAEITSKNPPFVPAFDPDSPFANAEGAIGLPNVDLAEEAVNLALAKTAYKASLNVLKTIDEMENELLRSVDRQA